MSQPQPIDPRYVSRSAVPPRKRRRWFGKTVGLLVLLFVLMLICVPLYAWSRIDKIDAFPTAKRPADTPGTTFLLVGSDSRSDLSRSERARLRTGGEAGQRTDTIMLLHAPESGPPVLVSVPRDSRVKIPGRSGQHKINAAYAYGKGNPQLLVQTLENKTGLRIDHYVEIGFGGFASIVDSVGGIEMCLPKAMKDDYAHIDLPAGCQELDGVKALGYVRARHVDASSDLGRVKRQREMIGAVADKAVSPWTFVNPVRYYNLSTSGVDALTVDKEMGLTDFARFVLAMKAVAAGGDGVNLTIPVSNGPGGTVIWKERESDALWKALRSDSTGSLKSS